MRRVEPKKGEKFDHKLHQAMFEVPTAELAPGTIAEVIQGGYVIADRLLRPALVGVAKAATGCCGGTVPPAARQPVRHHGLTAATRTGNGGGAGHG